MSEIPCPYCESTCKIPNDNEEKIECPDCGKIFLYIPNTERHGTIDYRPAPEINNRDIQTGELKADKTFVFGEECEAYKKSEADLMIAEKDKEIAELNERFFELQETAIKIDKKLTATRKQLRHQKYKRCLAMARWCEAELEKFDYKASVEYTNKDVWRIATSYFTIWRRHWLELAEKFKPNNTTAQ